MLLDNFLMREGKFSEAAEHYHRLSKIKPGSIDSPYREGLAWSLVDNCERSIEALEYAYQLNPNYGYAIQALSRAYSTCPSATEQQRNQALELAMEVYGAQVSSDTIATVAMAMAALGRFDEAIKYQDDALAISSVVNSAVPAQQTELKKNLKHFQSEQMASRAWSPDHPDMAPPALRFPNR